MGEIVNLRAARKAKERLVDAAKAVENRVRFGRTKSQKQAEAVEAARVSRILDGAKRD
jgi:hypothetical protein